MMDELVCTHCNSKEFYFNSYEESIRVIIYNREKIEYDIKAPLDPLNYWYCNKCHEHATEEQCKILANLYSKDGYPERWLLFEAE